MCCLIVNMQDYKVNKVFTSVINGKRCDISLSLEERDTLEEMLNDLEMEELYKDVIWK